MNYGKNGLMGPMLIAAPLTSSEKEVDLKGRSPWVGLYRTLWFQFLVSEPGGFVCPVTPRHPLYTCTASFNLEQSWGKFFTVICAVSYIQNFLKRSKARHVENSSTRIAWATVHMVTSVLFYEGAVEMSSPCGHCNCLPPVTLIPCLLESLHHRSPTCCHTVTCMLS